MNRKLAQSCIKKWLKLGEDQSVIEPIFEENIKNCEWWRRLSPILASIFPAIGAQISSDSAQKMTDFDEDLAAQISIEAMMRNVFEYH